jgi:hypothetical protein
VRLITRGGYNWASRYPWIVETALKIRQTHFVLDGEAVVLGVTGNADFDALRPLGSKASPSRQGQGRRRLHFEQAGRWIVTGAMVGDGVELGPWSLPTHRRERNTLSHGLMPGCGTVIARVSAAAKLKRATNYVSAAE